MRELGYVIYPSLDKSELRIGVSFGSPDTPVLRNDVDAQKRLALDACAHLKGDFPWFLDLFLLTETDQFYFNELAQIQMPSWSRSRVVLAGDAAHCASPFFGAGNESGNGRRVRARA